MEPKKAGKYISLHIVITSITKVTLCDSITLPYLSNITLFHHLIILIVSLSLSLSVSYADSALSGVMYSSFWELTSFIWHLLKHAMLTMHN